MPYIAVFMVATVLVPSVAWAPALAPRRAASCMRARFSPVDFATAPALVLSCVRAEACSSAAAARAAVSPEKLNQLRDLTPREREIALLVCEGCSNAEVAKRLSKSVLTIKTQLNAVFRKLGVASRAKLMALLR